MRCYRFIPTVRGDAASKATVKLAFTITAEGKVENVRVIESSPANVFDREARKAAVRWRFAPRTEQGRSVAREAVKTLQFRLEKRGR